MESFEHLVKVMLEAAGYVVTSNIKFDVTKKTNKKTTEYQTHGYEIDIVGARSDSLILGSVKSFFGSGGVDRQGFRDIAVANKKTYFDRYKIFNDDVVRDGVLKVAHARYGYPLDKIHLVLYVGNFKRSDESLIRVHLGKLKVGAGTVNVVGLDEIVEGILRVSEKKTYSNDPVIMTIKALIKAGYLQDRPKAI